ncbi:uncharacterized protein VTP21DRAFT_4686 [Calcarisporiella thermophila]|uniref:uncharacterized protein n=1 Tax=Calcarisporiella thermophila TaxID=911321 RepID=UPI00374487E5
MASGEEHQKLLDRIARLSDDINTQKEKAASVIAGRSQRQLPSLRGPGHVNRPPALYRRHPISKPVYISSGRGRGRNLTLVNNIQSSGVSVAPKLSASSVASESSTVKKSVVTSAPSVGSMATSPTTVARPLVPVETSKPDIVAKTAPKSQPTPTTSSKISPRSFSPISQTSSQGRSIISRNRTLVNNAIKATNGNETDKLDWIHRRTRHMQLINKAAFKDTIQSAIKTKTSTSSPRILGLKKKKPITPKLTKEKIVNIGGKKYKKSSDGRKLVISDDTPQEVTIDGVLFIRDPTGRKLVRKGTPALPSISSTANSLSTSNTITPKKINVNGVLFVRTKRGNLIRAEVANKLAKRSPTISRNKTYRRSPLKFKTTPGKSKRKLISKPCIFFQRFGTCKRGDTCPYLHDRERLAICKKFLRNACPHVVGSGVIEPDEKEVAPVEGKSGKCKLSHTPTAHNTPSCLHFLRGNCTHTNCPYPHVNVNRDAPVCSPFAREGYCPLGSSCKEQHIWVCPDYAERGECSRKGCKLPHVSRKEEEEKRMRLRLERRERKRRLIEAEEMNDMKEILPDFEAIERGMGSIESAEAMDEREQEAIISDDLDMGLSDNGETEEEDEGEEIDSSEEDSLDESDVESENSEIDGETDEEEEEEEEEGEGEGEEEEETDREERSLVQGASKPEEEGKQGLIPKRKRDDSFFSQDFISLE